MAEDVRCLACSIGERVLLFTLIFSFSNGVVAASVVDDESLAMPSATALLSARSKVDIEEGGNVSNGVSLDVITGKEAEETLSITTLSMEGGNARNRITAALL